MSFLLTLFLVVFVWWLIKSIIRVMPFVKTYRQIYNQMNGAQRPQQQQPQGRKAGWTAPMRRRKKIDPSVGEYVKFTETETTVSSTTDSAGNSEIKAESQITDVEWEEIPDEKSS